MLMVNQLVGFGAGGAAAAAAPTRVYVGSTGDATNQQNYTFTNHAIGAAASDRLVVVVITWEVNSGGTINLSSVSIGGNAATIIRQDEAPTSRRAHSAIAALAVASGSTATIAVGLSATNANSCAVHVYALYGLTSTTPFANNGNGVQTAASVSTTLDIPAGGVAVAGSSHNGAATGEDATVTGLDEDVDMQTTDQFFYHQAASSQGMSAETGRTITTSSALANASRSISAASWA